MFSIILKEIDDFLNLQLISSRFSSDVTKLHHATLSFFSLTQLLRLNLDMYDKNHH